jgi:N-acetylneuraminic acid mutarotase
MKKKNVALLLALVIIVSSCTATILAANAAENSWINRPPMPNAKSGLEIAVVNGKIYALGHDGTNEEYDPATLTWTTKKPIPTSRSSFGIAVYQNKIYVIGGNVGFDSTTELPILCSLNEVYDPLTDTWESKKPMPTNRSQLNANVVNGKIYLIGGRTGGQYSTVDLNEVYDPETDSWTTKASIPYPVVQYASAVVPDKIYIIGGQDEYSDSMNLDLVQIYDPSTDTWSFGTPMPNVVWQAAAGATTGVWAPKRIYVFGGLPEHSLFGTNITQVYNPENDSWTLGASMPTSRFNFAVGVVNDTLYALGGAPFFNVQGNAIAANELYIPFGYEGPLPPYWSPPTSPSPSPTTAPSNTLTPSPSTTPSPEPSLGSWETMSPVPQGRLGAGVAAANEKIYVIGGISEKALSINQEYDPSTDTWTTKELMPTARSAFAMAVYQNKIYCIGGGGDFGMDEVTGLNHVYDPATDTWGTLMPMPTARQFLDANVVGGKIYLIGGSKPVNLNNPSYVPNVNEVYDPTTDSWDTKTPPPVNVSNYASAVVDGKIYIISGSGASGSLTQIYNPETDSWSYGALIPKPVWGAAAGVTTGVSAPKRIYVLGGYPAFNSNQIYDPETDSWATGTQMPTGRYGLGVAVLDDRLYAIGGSGYEAGKANECYTPAEYNPAATNSESFPTILVITASVIAVFIVGASLLVYFKKRKHFSAVP